MEKYRLVQESKAEDSHEFVKDSVTDNFPEVRITQQGKPRSYISYSLQLFTDGTPTIVLKAMGRAINKAVTIAEIIKRKLPVHQVNQLSSVEMVDVYAPLEEGLDPVTSRRYVSCLRIVLSVNETAVDTSHYGYQPPLPVEERSPMISSTRADELQVQALNRQQHQPYIQQQYQLQQQRQVQAQHQAQYRQFAAPDGGASPPQHYLMSPHA